MLRAIHSLSMLPAICILMAPRLAAQTIEGHVLNAATGEAVTGARVRIFPAGGRPADGYATATDRQGGFRIEGVKAGAYRAMYAAPGFSPIPTPGDLPAAFPVADGGGPVRLEVKLQPLARISGRVADATGKPVANAAIWLIREERWCMPPECHPDHRQSKSGENGEFAVNDLTPGPWLVAATAPPSWGAPASRGDERLGWAQTFYPGVIDPRLAEAVLLQPGSEQWNTDIRLTAAPLHRLLGRVLDPRGDPAPKASVTLGKGFGPALTEEANADGAFEFAVVDDQWSVSAALDRNVVKLRSTRTVDLRGRDSEDIEMRLSAPFTLQGKIVMEVPDGMPAPEPPPIDIGLVPNVPMLSDGPGDFLDIRTDDDSLTSLKRIVSGSRCLSGRLPGAVSHRLAGSVLSRLHPPGRTRRRGIIPGRFGESVGGGTVRGTLDGCETHHVFLVPQEAVLRRDGFIRIATCDRNGRFEFPAVRPGEYYGIAMAKEPRSFADLSDDRVLSQGSKVTVRANESTSADLQLSRR